MNLNLTQAQWNRFYYELALWFAVLRDIREWDDLTNTASARTQIINWNDYNANFTGLTLVGVDFTANTDKDGSLRARVALNGGGPNVDVSLFKATGGGGGNLVAKATNVAPGATGTLVAQNGSSMSGTVTVANPVTPESDDKHQLFVIQDFALRAPKVWTGTNDGTGASQGTGADDKASSDLFTAALKGVNGAIQTARTSLTANFRTFCRGRFNHFLLVNDASPYQETFQSPDGNVSVQRSGNFVDMALDMADEANAGAQAIVRRNPAAGAGVFSAVNDGLGTVASSTPKDSCPLGVFTFTCVAGIDTIQNWTGNEQFDCAFSPTVTTDDPGITSVGIKLQPNKTWFGPRGIGPLNLLRTLTKTGDGGNNDFATAANFSVVGENATNTNAGVLYAKVTGGVGAFVYSFYSDSNYVNLVAQSPAVAAGASFVATAQNNSGLTVNGKAGAGPTNGNTASFNLNPFKVKNLHGVQDRFTVTVTAGVLGLIADTIAEEFAGAFLNAVASGSETFFDAFMKAGTFAPFITLDN